MFFLKRAKAIIVFPNKRGAKMNNVSYLYIMKEEEKLFFIFSGGSGDKRCHVNTCTLFISTKKKKHRKNYDSFPPCLSFLFLTV